MRDLYEILGIDRTAGESEIKTAYRKRSKQTHPDKNGGNASEEFREVQTAFDILSDPQKRRAYDEGGDVDAAGSGMTRLEMMLRASVSILIRKAAPTVNLIEALRGQLRGAMEVKRAELEEAESERARFLRMNGKHKRKGEGANIFEGAIDEAIANREVQIAACKADIQDGVEMLRYLDEYEFTGPKPLTLGRMIVEQGDDWPRIARAFREVPIIE